MISVCATIHNSPKSVEAFVRSIYDNATGEDFEVILISDRNPPEEDELLRQLATSLPRLSLIPVGKSDQLSRQWNLVTFWRDVYGDEIDDYAAGQLIRFERDGIDLWFQYAYGLNLAASKAKGEFLLLTPADFVILSDVHKLSKVCEGYTTTHDGRFFGHFSLVQPFDAWTDFSGRKWMVEAIPGDRYGRNGRRMASSLGAVFNFLKEWYVEPDDFPFVLGTYDRYWPFNHGIRVVDRKTFNEVGGLRDDFLSKAGPTNIFNRMARAIAYGPEHARENKSIEDLTGFRARMASVPFDDDPPIEYLYPTPCCGDVVCEMQYAEEKCVVSEHPELKGLWK